MGLEYDIICKDCKQWTGLGKALVPNYLPKIEEALKLINEVTVLFTIRALNVNYFLRKHKGHRVGIWVDDGGNPRQDNDVYAEVKPFLEEDLFQKEK